MLGRAGDSARSTGPQHPFRPGPPAAAPSLLLRPPFSARAAKRWPPISPRLAATAFLPAGRLRGVREEAARARAEWVQRREPAALGKAGSSRGGGRATGRERARKRRARREQGAPGSEARGAPRGPAASPADFRMRWGLRRGLASVTSLHPGGTACQPSWPALPSAPIRKGSGARAGDLVSRQVWGRGSAGIRAPAPGAGRESEMKRLSPGNTYPSLVQVQLPPPPAAAGPRPRAPGSFS